MEENAIKPTILMILDGWGIASPSRGNAISQAKTPNFNNLIANYPTVALQASGEVVGLTWGEMGNSEVGHLSIGAGRTIYQSLARIHKSIITKTFFSNPVFLSLQKHIENNASSLHLIGLVSNGGVHSHQDHLHALLDMCKELGIKNVFVHAILDGRDTERDEGINNIRALEKKMSEVKIGKIASISGRFYAMDRDRHWDRTDMAYKAMAEGEAKHTAENPLQAIESSYSNHIYDEEFEPCVITKGGNPITKIQDGDGAIFFNFRQDRARQLTAAFILPGFEKFKRRYCKNLYAVTFTEYDNSFPAEVAFPPIEIKNTLPQVIASNGLHQLHAAETEKYAHVTFFLNGGIENPLENEERILVPSPSVSSYDQKPEMSAYDLTSKVIKEIQKNKHHFIVMNFANADMVGHTGNMRATIEAVQVLDECMDKIVKQTLAKNGTIFITADHGNAEEIMNIHTGEIIKEHSKNPVPFIMINEEWTGKSSRFETSMSGNDLSTLTPAGMLTDIAPTILKFLHLDIPKEMTGSPLILF